MSRYSFIDENVNLTGKQCFCIDVNSTNSPFIIGGNQLTQPLLSAKPQSPTRPQSPSKIVSAPAPVAVPPEALIRGYEGKYSEHQGLTNDYLLTPNVINSNKKEKQVINTVNELLAQAYSNVQKEILGSNAAEMDIPKTSMTVMPDETKTKTKTKTKSKSKSKVDLNTMANDKLVGKKTFRKSSSNLNLFEGFEESGCKDVCKPSNSVKKYSRVKSSSSKSKSNENLYLFVMILLLFACSWFKK